MHISSSSTQRVFACAAAVLMLAATVGGREAHPTAQGGAAPVLTLVKHMRNLHGGTAAATAWLLSATGGPTPISGQGGVASGATFKEGTYTLGESGGPAGYAAGAWACEGATVADNRVTIAAGQSVTCAITNSDVAPSLTLVNQVSNMHGGTAEASAWRLTASGAAAISGQGGATSGTTFQAGTYTLAVTGGPSGYAASAWSCAGGTQNGNRVALSVGQRAICTITHTDLGATLIVRKVVVNDSGGTSAASSFSFQVNGAAAVSFSAGGAATMTVSTGTYTVTEPATTGYVVSYSNCTKLVIPNGATGTCTITNNDAPPAAAIAQASAPCAMFAAGLPSSALVSSILYGTDSTGRIAGSVDPAVFVSYSRVTVSEAATITISEKSNATSPDPPVFRPLDGQAIVYTNDCVAIPYAPQLDAVTGLVTFDRVAPGAYIIAVRYSARAIMGQMGPSPAAVTYTFYANVNGTPVAHNANGLLLKKQ